MGKLEDKLGELEKSVLGNKTNNKEYETIVVFDAEIDNSVTVDIDLTDISDDRELEFFFDEKGADELLTNCKQLKMKASDGKMRKTDVANTEQLLRICFIFRHAFHFFK